MPEPEPEWTTSITLVEPGLVRVRGHAIEELIRGSSAAASLWLVLTGTEGDAATMRTLDAVLAACVDHGLVSTATTAARYVMSGSDSLIAALAAGLLAFGQHTGTSNLTAVWLRHLAQPAGDVSDPEPDGVSDTAIAAAVAAARAARVAVPGFGHPMHREVDPRETALRAVITECGTAGPYVRLLDRVHAALVAALGRPLVMNVDGLIGAVLSDMGLAPSAILAVNLIGAMPGIAAHAIEEQSAGRPLRVPRAAEVRYEEKGFPA
jgi:citrate synthase